MSVTDRVEPIRRASGAGRTILLLSFLSALVTAAFVAVAQSLLFSAVVAREGHDHDKPPPLNLPAAPRVVAVATDYELVDVLSGERRLTFFRHHFETGEPVKNAAMLLSVGEGEAEVAAVEKEAGVFEVSPPWIRAEDSVDIIFKLTLPDTQDVEACRNWTLRLRLSALFVVAQSRSCQSMAAPAALIRNS